MRERIAALGPGILVASAAIGGSHLVSSTQAGAIFQWQLVWLVVAANILKYPFFRFGPQFTVESGMNLVEGYAAKGRAYVWVFFVFCAVSAVISTAGVAVLCSAILLYAFPSSWGLTMPVTSIAVMAVTLLMLLGGHYRLLDRVSKFIVATLAVATVFAVFMAAANGSQAGAEAVAPNPWTWANFAFIIALMGWMPAPVEVSALNSMWVVAKQRQHRSKAKDVIFDFNVGYVTSAVLAVFFVALGALVQFGTGVKVETAGGAYIPQLISMYGTAIGQWAVPIVTLIAFFCMFGTTITVVDGYARASGEALRLVRRDTQPLTRRATNAWTIGIALVGLAIVLWMSDQMGGMLRFAMISAFIMAPVFAWLNYSLVRDRHDLSPVLRYLSYAGLVFLGGFTLIFLANLVGLVG